MQKKVVFVIDGWFMKKRIINNLKLFLYNGNEIRNYCKHHIRPDFDLYRIFYYDTKPLNAKGHHPLTGKAVNFGTNPVAIKQNELLDSIKKTPNFALRLGETVWQSRAWELSSNKLKALVQKKITVADLNTGDIKPKIRQKAVDMKIGLDIANMATKKVADLLIIITGDSDIVPALKFARREGMMVGLDTLGGNIRPELSEHVDFISNHINKYKKPKGNP